MIVERDCQVFIDVGCEVREDDAAFLGGRNDEAAMPRREELA